MEHFFPRIQVQTCAQMHTRVKLVVGMQMKTILKMLGGIYPTYPPGFRHPWARPYYKSGVVTVEGNIQ